MNTRSYFGTSSIKPYCTVLINCRNSSFYGCPILKRTPFNHVHSSKSTFSQRNNELRFRCAIESNRTIFSGFGSNWGQPRDSPIKGIEKNCKYGSVIANVASNTRNHSNSVDSSLNENNFEKLYVHAGFNVKPLVIEKIDEGKNDSVGKENDYCVNENIDRLSEDIDTSESTHVSWVEKEAWDLLKAAVVNYCGNPVGTVAAANGPDEKHSLNYDQLFIRDFVPSALAFLLNGEREIVKNFLLHTLQLQLGKDCNCYSPGQGLMPASFKIRTVPLEGRDGDYEDVLDPDFGESAIGRVAPVDSGLWWIILLRAYGRITADYTLQERVDVQTGIHLILKLCLTDGFDMFPTLLALFYSALRCSREILTVNDSTKNLVVAINNRLSALSFHIREYYWVDITKVNEIHRYKTEEYSTDATNKFNIYPDQIPGWLADWITDSGGYFVGNLEPAHMDFRFFTLGNLWSVVSSLSTSEQSEGILNLIEEKWDDLVSWMPMKICYPALEHDEWRIITGGDPKNTPWSYHNGGSWPTLLWQFTLACIKMGRPELARKAVALAEERLSADHWPEYYDTRYGRLVGKQARLPQTWTIAGYLTSKLLLDNAEMASLLFWNEDYEVLGNCVCGLKNGPGKCSRLAI